MDENNFGNIKCPQCGHMQRMKMPQNACLPFYECRGCGKIIRAEKSCCVFCDYADKPCPVSENKK